MPTILELTFEELRSLTLAVLRQYPEIEWSYFLIRIGQVAADRGFLDRQQEPRRYPDLLPPVVKDLLQEVVWGLIAEGVVVPGRPATLGDGGWPHFHLTAYGRRVLSEPGPIPHDPQGYIRHIESEVPDLSPLNRMYVIEAIECFRAGRYLSVAVMVGVAAECALLHLTEAVIQWLPPKKAGEVRNLVDGTRTRKLATRIKSELDGRRGQTDGIAKLLDSRAFEVESLIRDTRNEAGHPTGIEVDRDDAYGLLRLLPRQLRLMYDLATLLYRQPPGSA